MILQVSEDVKRIGIRIKSWRSQRYVDSWENIQLLITPGQRHQHCCCHEGGSPWIVYGCWPGHRTGVDLMNPLPPDFAAFLLDAEKKEDDLIVFVLPDRWHETVPFGRYSAAVRYQPDGTFPVNFYPWNEGKDIHQHDWSHLDPGCYHMPADCGCHHAHHHHHPRPPLRMCVLAEFDIDYGPRCSQHIMDKAAIELGE